MSETQAIPSSLPLDHSLIPAYAMTSDGPLLKRQGVEGLSLH